MVSGFFITSGVSVLSLIYVVLIFIMFILKGRTKRSEEKLYMLLLVFGFISLGLFIFSSYLVTSGNVLHNLFSRMYIYFTLIWILLVFQYMMIVFLRLGNLIQEKKYILYASTGIFSIISVILCCTLSCNFVGTGIAGAYVLEGNLITYYKFWLVMLFIFMVLIFIIQRKKLDKEVVILFVSSVIVLNIGTVNKLIFNVDISNTPLLFSLFMTFLYFTVESQDSNLLAEFNDSTRKAEESNKLKSEFIMNMSHQLRTPMNTILGFSDIILMNDNLDLETVKDDVSNIKISSRNLLNLINAILDISKIEGNKEVVHSENYNLENIIYDLSSNINSKLKDNMVFTINADEICPNELVGDAYKLCKILNIIILNAINHTEYGEVSLNVSCIQVDSSNFQFIFLIKNSGHLMNHEDFNRSFEDLIKLSNDNKSEISADVLNLIVAKRLLELIGGSVEFVNETGKGTQYIIKLNQKLYGQNRLGNIKEKIQTKHELSHRVLSLLGKKVLIVDDNKVNVVILQRLLSQYNISIDTSLNPRDAVELVGNNKYDFVIVNHNMDEISGEEFVSRLNSTGNRVPPVVGVITKTNEVKDVYSYVIEFPVEFRELNKIINKIFNGGDL